MKRKLNNVPKQKITWRVRLEFKLQDAWLGVFWATREPKLIGDPYKPQIGDNAPKWKHITDVWVCLLPCLPIHITHTRKWADPAPKGIGESWPLKDIEAYQAGVDWSEGRQPEHFRAKLECVIKLSEGSEQRSSGIFESKDGVLANVDQIVFPRTIETKHTVQGWVNLGPNHIPFMQDRLVLQAGDQIVIEPGQWSSSK